MSQSPLVGAFVPAAYEALPGEDADEVAIPSGRGIRSGYETSTSEQSPELWVAIPSGRGIRSGEERQMVEKGRVLVAIPSGRGIRSGLSQAPPTYQVRYVAIPSGRGIRSGTINLRMAI